MANQVNLLLTGATGYIGGSVLNQLLTSTNPTIKSIHISLLLRDDDRAAYYRSLGVKIYIFTSLDDHEAIVAAASQNDIVLHIASGLHPGSTRSHIEGLSKRKVQTGKPVHYVHQSGTSDFADRPVSKSYLESRIFVDTDTDLLAYLRAREDNAPYDQRTAALAAVEAGLKTGVATTIVETPLIFGDGTGKYNKDAIQIPILMGVALKAGHTEYIGEGKGMWDYVHIEDLAKLWELMIVDLIEEKHVVPTGETGFIFTSVGRYSWGGLSQDIANAGKELGLLQTNEAKSIELTEAAETWTPGWPDALQLAEAGLASNAKTDSEIAKKLGWAPVYKEDAFQEDIRRLFKTIAARQQT